MCSIKGTGAGALNVYANDLRIIAELPTQLIMKITGHKTEKSFNAYVRFSNEDNAIKLKEHAFFN